MYLAYLDAGTGGMLASAVVAGFAGTVVVVKLWWRRALGTFRRQPTDVEPAPASSDQDG